jgi:tetratricopeptide (TPR) repeat protein
LVGAVQHYEAAAKLADEAAVMNRLLERASECRRQGFLAQARQAEGRGDWSDAATALAQALALKDDPLVRVRRAEMVRRAEADEAWRFHLEAGERELAGGNCARAQEHFRQALKIKPQSVEPQEKLRHAEARLQIEQGDVARGRGDLESARRLYEAAQVQCPALRPEVERRLVDLARQVAGGETLVAEVERLAKEGRASEALARLGRTSGELPPKLFETLRDGLAELQAVEIRLENLRPILAKAETALNEGIAAEKDSELQELPANVAALEKDRATLVASSRGRFLGRDLAALKTSGEESLKLALRVSEALSQARELSDAKAREAGQFVGLRWGFIRLGRKEDRVKEERLTKLAVVLGGLAEEAKLLGR